MMKIKFFGAGGSVSATCPERTKYGTNTPCVLVEAGGQFIVLDMGTGLSVLSEEAQALQLTSAHILLSHYHFDHIEGFGFFAPFFSPEGTFTIYAQPAGGENVQTLLHRFLHPPFFPITTDVFKAKMNYRDVLPGESFNLGKDIVVHTTPTHHPCGCIAYRIEHEGKALVYMLDHEHGTDLDQKLTAFCKNADMVIYDASLTNEEYASGKFKGWGHSTPEAGAELAQKAGIKTLVLAHHAMKRTDKQLEQMEAHTQMLFSGAVAAREGMVIIL